MNIWFLVLIGLFLLSLGITLAKHGEQKREVHNFWVVLISGLIQVWLIYMAVSVGF
ncbi:hypothetical protein [Virgibacillus profundi]|uniref:hypothetical protein n=1 Tax=Virgibacillus profundi TaxID=2024555 RepID=UPI0013FDD620|nr:hypothetical protein [Virgibacillus profundi]